MLAGAAGGALIRSATSLLGRGTSETISATASDAAAATQDAAATAAQDAGSAERSLAGASCGGLSFSADTRVLLASGKTTQISSLHVGQKVLAASTRTGKNQTRPVAAVMVHHDTNLYDLTVKTTTGTTVIHTTSNHPFWAPGAHRWIKAAALRHGTHLRTPTGPPATVIGGHTPRRHTAWMWDLTIPTVHDFYIQASPATNSPHTYHVEAGAPATAVLVHNCDITPGRSFKDHFLRHKGLLQAVTGNRYRTLAEGGPQFLSDLRDMVKSGDLRFDGVGTLKAGADPALIYRGRGLTLVTTRQNEFWTLLRSGQGLDKGIRMLPYGPEAP